MINIGVLIGVIGGAIGMACSALTLYIIYRMGRWNAYIKLIVALTSSQFIYDLSVFMIAFNGFEVEFIYIAFRSMSGLWAAFITNVLSFVVIWTVWTLTPANISGRLGTIFSIIFIPATLYGVLVPYALYYFSDSDFDIVSHIYFWARAISIIFNVVSYIGLVCKLYSLEHHDQFGSVLMTPLKVLTRRFKYYPVVQVLARAGVAWHEYIYGHGYTYYQNYSLQRSFALFIYVITLPSAGLGYFLVFIAVCPGAFTQLKKDLSRYLWCFTRRKENAENFDEFNNTFAGFRATQHSTASNLSESFRERDSDWSVRDSVASEGGGSDEEDSAGGKSPSINPMASQVKRESTARRKRSSSRISRITSSTSPGRADYSMWGEDELTQEISRLRTSDIQQVMRDSSL